MSSVVSDKSSQAKPSQASACEQYTKFLDHALKLEDYCFNGDPKVNFYVQGVSAYARAKTSYCDALRTEAQLRQMQCEREEIAGRGK